MPNVAELIKDHVTLTVDCVDRVYLNAYVPRCTAPAGVVSFLRQRGQRRSHRRRCSGRSPRRSRTELRAWCDAQDIPWLEFKKGERKDDVVQPYRDRFTDADGVVLVGVAQERASGLAGTKRSARAVVHFDYRAGRRSA